MQADIRCTTMGRLFFFPLLGEISHSHNLDMLIAPPDVNLYLCTSTMHEERGLAATKNPGKYLVLAPDKYSTGKTPSRHPLHWSTLEILHIGKTTLGNHERHARFGMRILGENATGMCP